MQPSTTVPAPQPQIGSPRPSFGNVDGKTFLPATIQACAAKLIPVLPQINDFLADKPESYRIESAIQDRSLPSKDLQVLEFFTSAGGLLIAAFGPAQVTGYHEDYLDNLLSSVKRHLWLAQEMGLIESSETQD
jgi:hypothetical protein